MICCQLMAARHNSLCLPLLPATHTPTAAHVVLASQNVSPLEHSTPNMATMSPAAASVMSSSSSACMRTRRGTCGTMVAGKWCVSEPWVGWRLMLCSVQMRGARPGTSGWRGACRGWVWQKVGQPSSTQTEPSHIWMQQHARLGPSGTTATADAAVQRSDSMGVCLSSRPPRGGSVRGMMYNHSACIRQCTQVL